MVNEVSDRTGQVGDVVAGGIALATLIVADQVTALHPLFGLLVFLYLIQDFKRPTSCCNRVIVSLAISFASLLFTCYPIDLILAHYDLAKSWDIILLIQGIFIGIVVFAIKTEFELRRVVRGET